MLAHWIWLAHRPKVGDKLKAELLHRFSGAEDVFLADRDALSALTGISAEALESLCDKDLDGAKQILRDCASKDIHVLTLGEEAYPARLRHIPDPPVVLYYKGSIPDFDNRPVIGMVGTRKASAYGINSARRLGFQIARCGGTVVSGLAAGIDAAAMTGAMSAAGCVVGVLGCGVDVVYPAKNRSLFGQTEQYGCLLSEFAPGTPPIGYHFPKRNRIISGLCNGVLVVEAPEKSGALITADLALEQGRDVFAVPGNIDLPTFAGSNRLIRDGALPVTSGWDVMSEYTARYPDFVRRDMTPEPAREGVSAEAKVAQRVELPRKTKAKKEKSYKKDVDKKPHTAYSDVNKELPALSSQEQAIVNALRGGERLVDDVIGELGLPAGQVSIALTMLAVKGVICRLPGNRIAMK